MTGPGTLGELDAYPQKGASASFGSRGRDHSELGRSRASCLLRSTLSSRPSCDILKKPFGLKIAAGGKWPDMAGGAPRSRRDAGGDRNLLLAMMPTEHWNRWLRRWRVFHRSDCPSVREAGKHRDDLTAGDVSMSSLGLLPGRGGNGLPRAQS